MSEADPDQREAPQRIYFIPDDQKRDGGIERKILLPSPNTEKRGIGQRDVWKTPLNESREGLYNLYFENRPSIHTIGWKVGLKTFHSIIQEHRELGYDVPPSLYVYDGQKRGRIRTEIHRRKRDRRGYSPKKSS